MAAKSSRQRALEWGDRTNLVRTNSTGQVRFMQAHRHGPRFDARLSGAEGMSVVCRWEIAGVSRRSGTGLWARQPVAPAPARTQTSSLGHARALLAAPPASASRTGDALDATRVQAVVIARPECFALMIVAAARRASGSATREGRAEQQRESDGGRSRNGDEVFCHLIIPVRSRVARSEPTTGIAMHFPCIARPG